jgi:protein-L-isoaspartate(D-aspartate) O-methyltransferase
MRKPTKHARAQKEGVSHDKMISSAPRRLCGKVNSESQQENVSGSVPRPGLFATSRSRYFRGYPLALFVLCLFSLCTDSHGEELRTEHFTARRERMVREQIEARGITDTKVLNALRKVERHRFVPDNLASEAYTDSPLPIGEGQTISQPYIVAFMTQILGLDVTKKVLEVGTGSGYQAAILAEICREVYTVEIIDSLAEQAKQRLSELGYLNIRVKTGDGYQGWKEFAPFDAILVTCAPTHIPDPLKEQLAEGGRMVIPVGERRVQELVLLRKEKGRLIQESVLPVRFVPMLKDKENFW